MDLNDNDKVQEKTAEDTEKKMEETAVFKTPSFVIPSKNKVQNKMDSAFNFKAPDLLPPKLTKLSKDKPKEISEDGKHINNDTKTDESETKSVDTESVHIKTETGTDKQEAGGMNPVKSTKQSTLSPAEQLKYAQSAVPYKEPPWSKLCTDKFALEVIKNGSIIDKIELDTKAFYVIGRLPSCDIPMEHPSMSRYHAILQYSNGSVEAYPKGWFLYDLDSTHGTWINKNKVPPLKYHPIHVDFCLKFGGSTRLFILQGPDEDREEELELSVKEMQQQREKQIKEAELLKQAELEDAQRKAEILKRQEEARGCSWGINEEEVEEEEEDLGENPFAVMENEELYIDDPKKSLNGYFEREGLDPPQYEFTEAGFGKWKCCVELPLDTPSGEPMIAEVVQSGKKREAVVACALEACRILDRHGVLRQSTHESKKRKQKNWEEDDFYDSDEDVYLDRTGTIEKKREIRKGKVGKSDKKADTYESLMEKHDAIVKEMGDIESKLEHAKAQAASIDSDDIDALDAYMSAIKSGMMDTRTKMSLKRRMMELKQEEQKVRKLINIAKPASLPDLITKPAGFKSGREAGLGKPASLPDLKPAGSQKTALTSVTGSVGKMKGAVTGKPTRKPIVAANNVNINKANEEEEFKEEIEEEDEENEMETENQTNSKGNIGVKKDDSSHKNENTNVVETKAKVSQAQDIPKPKMKGPSLPLAAVLEKLQSESDNNADDNQSDLTSQIESTKTRNENSGKRKQKLKDESSKKMKQTVADPDLDDPEYASWIPPENQAGDGKTHLNAKFGY